VNFPSGLFHSDSPPPSMAAWNSHETLHPGEDQ
jgi:hypothetical protein